jgi:signal transduction histidine kinase
MTKRLLLGYLIVTVIVLVLLEVPLAVFYAQRERERLVADVEHDAAVIATLYEDDLERDRPLDPRPAAEYLDRTGARVVVVDRDGISLVDTDRDVNRDFSTRPEIALALAGTQSSGTRPSETLGTDLLFVAMPVASGGTVHGALRVTLGTSDVNARIERFWLALAGIATVVLVAVALIGWGIARSVTRPLRRLNAAASRFAQGDLTVGEEPNDGPLELRDLSDTMTTMARRLDDLLQAQRSFVADASHQLRTPLTALRLRLENLQSRLAGDGAVELDAAIDETNRLATLVSDLLQLARTDEHPASGVADLAQLTADRVDTWTAVAEAKGVLLRHDELDRPAPVHVIPGAVEQILDNLIDNAVNASPVGATVTARITPTIDSYELTITDQGLGLTDEQKAQATRRFWRADTTRPGTGLGLAIVDALASASGGSVALADAPGGGLTVTVSLLAAGEVSDVQHPPSRAGAADVPVPS